MASFSLRLPAARTRLAQREERSVHHEDVDHYFRSAVVFERLERAFADPTPLPTTAYCNQERFELVSVGRLLDVSALGVARDLPLALVHPNSRAALTTAFGVDDLGLPSLLADETSGPFERESWRPVLLAGLALGRDGNTVNANDVVVAQGGDRESDAYVLVRYLAALFGHRRSYLFAPSLATRMHNVFLPLGRLVTTNGSAHELLVAPFVTLVGSSAHRAFRRTVTVTMVVMPVERPGVANPLPDDISGMRLRTLEDSELVDVAAQWDWSPARLRRNVTEYELQGALRTYLDQSPNWAPVRRPTSTLRSLAETLLVTTALSVSLGRTPSARLAHRRHAEVCRRQVVHEALQSLHIAKTSTILSWSHPEPGARATGQAANTAASLTNLLFSTVRLPLRESILGQFALPDPPIPEGAYISAYYLAPHATLVYSYVVAGEESERRSPAWMAAYLGYLGLALSGIRASLLALHREVDRLTDSPGELLQTAGALVELEEVFDLQFAVKAHRQYYEEIRRRDGAMDDYESLVKKISLLRDEATLRRQHQENHHVLEATVMIVVLTAILAIPAAVDLLASGTAHATRHAWGVVVVVIGATSAAFGIVLAVVSAAKPISRRAVRRWVRWRVARR